VRGDKDFREKCSSPPARVRLHNFCVAFPYLFKQLPASLKRPTMTVARHFALLAKPGRRHAYSHLLIFFDD
jgi:hypothetical protein